VKVDDLALYLVTDPDMGRDRGVLETCRQALASGVRTVQLRDKRAAPADLVAQGRRLKEMADSFGAWCLINDSVEAAAECGAHGVHLGQDDTPVTEARRILGPRAVIGASVQTPEDARRAEREGADYLAANMVYATATKTDISQTIGLVGVAALKAASRLPLVAIGGIKSENARAVIEAGADGVAVVSAIMMAEDVAAACRALLAAIERGKEKNGG